MGFDDSPHNQRLHFENQRLQQIAEAVKKQLQLESAKPNTDPNELITIYIKLYLSPYEIDINVHTPQFRKFINSVTQGANRKLFISILPELAPGFQPICMIIHFFRFIFNFFFFLFVFPDVNFHFFPLFPFLILFIIITKFLSTNP